MAIAIETSLSGLSDHDWAIISSRWARGIDWNIGKIGRKWEIRGRLGEGFPLFATKKAAYAAATELVLREGLHRSLTRSK